MLLALVSHEGLTHFDENVTFIFIVWPLPVAVTEPLPWVLSALRARMWIVPLLLKPSIWQVICASALVLVEFKSVSEHSF